VEERRAVEEGSSSITVPALSREEDDVGGFAVGMGNNTVEIEFRRAGRRRSSPPPFISATSSSSITPTGRTVDDRIFSLCTD
jgi:hypothetical protein